jgi:HD-like signal output (HDOD) protein
MTVNAQLRSLDIDIPTQPQALLQLSLLLAEEHVNLAAAATLIEGDMALAAAVLKAVNSSIYGLKGRVQSVQQAITYLGLREVVAITFELGLRAAFPPAPELDPLWQRAARRGALMGRLAQRLSLDAWAAHSAGLFEECGKAVLFKHASGHYRSMLRAASDDTELVQLEQTGFGISHDTLGAALCEGWGLGTVAVASVQVHVQAQRDRALTLPPALRSVAALSVLVHALMRAPQLAEEVASVVAPQAELDTTLVVRALRQMQEQLELAQEHARA